jgi:acyl-CoA reductase-like NAD-dependent aldehyde dehydrogenase
MPQRLEGQYSDSAGDGIANWSQRMPLGVTAGITPFDFPFKVPMWMAPVAIACGNSFIHAALARQRGQGAGVRHAGEPRLLPAPFR